MRKPMFDMQTFKQRRAELAKVTKGSAVIVPSHPEYSRNDDVHHTHRQDSSLFYLTGFEEPETVLVFRPGETPETVLFVRPKDELHETWEGFRYGDKGAKQEFGVDETYLIGDFDKKIIELLKPVDRIYYRWNIDKEWDHKILAALGEVRVAAGRTGRGHLAVHDAREVIGELRLRKSDDEIKTLREAGRISAEAHCEAMRFVKAGVNENQVVGVLLGTAHLLGANRQGYGAIVATGSNATTLHYTYNDQLCHNGDLLLIDAGFEKDYYTADITRTFPVSGKFTPAQKRVYEGVLKVQKAIIAMVKPGIPFKSLQDTTIEMLTDLMLELKLLSGSKAKLIESLEYKKYYMHGVSHWLGLDVHDVGNYLRRGESIPLEERMVFTVEPGIYIPAGDTSAPAEFRGIGIRIEDDIVVTASGCEVLTSGVPKDVDAIEAVMGEPSRWG